MSKCKNIRIYILGFLTFYIKFTLGRLILHFGTVLGQGGNKIFASPGQREKYIF